MKTLFGAAAVALFVMPITSQAAPVTYSGVRVLGFNETAPSNFAGTDLVTQAFDTSGGLSSLSGSKNFSGLDEDSNSANMTLTYAGQALATSSSLKAQVSGSLANAFYNASNDPFVINDSFDTNPNGIPTMISLESEARFSDTLDISGAGDLAYVTFNIGVDGSIDNGYTQLYKYGTASTAFGLLYNNGTDGNYDDVVSTSAFDVVGGKVYFDFSLQTVVGFDFGYEDLDPLMSGSVDFFNTVTLDQIIGYNSLGQQVDVSGAVGSDGFQFSTARVDDGPGDPTGVPEPAALALFGIGLAGLGGFTRRKRKTV